MPAPTVMVINRHRVNANRRKPFGEKDPVIAVKRGRSGKSQYHSLVEFCGHGHVIYDPEHPLPCGATCWIELDVEWPYDADREIPVI